MERVWAAVCVIERILIALPPERYIHVTAMMAYCFDVFSKALFGYPKDVVTPPSQRLWCA